MHSNCFLKGFNSFSYELIIQVPADESSLDSNGYIIDNQEIDRLINNYSNLHKAHSCEELCIRLGNSLYNYIIRKSNLVSNIKGFILRIKPDNDKITSYITYNKFSNEHHSIIF